MIEIALSMTITLLVYFTSSAFDWANIYNSIYLRLIFITLVIKGVNNALR